LLQIRSGWNLAWLFFKDRDFCSLNIGCLVCIFYEKFLHFYVFVYDWFSEATAAAAGGDKPSEERMPHNQSGDTAENSDAEDTAAVTLAENGTAVKFAPDGDVGTADGTLPDNEVPLSSADAIIITDKPDKDEKAKKEKPKVVGFFELVRFFCVHSFCQKYVRKEWYI